MAQKPSNLPLILFAVVGLGGLIGFNVLQQNNDPAIQERKQKEAEQEAARKQSKESANNPAPSEQTVPGANDVATWGAKKQFGKPGGSQKVTIAWEWTPAVQGNPSSIYTAVDMVKTMLPTAEIQVVNLDNNSGTGTPGILLDGTMQVPALPDGTFPLQPQMAMQLGKLMQKH